MIAWIVSSITCDKNSDKSNHKVFKFKSPAIKSRSKIIYDMINDIDQTQINRTTTTEITSTDEPFETDEQEEKQTNYNMLRSNSLVSSGVEKNSSTRSQFTNENNLNYEQAPEKKSQFTFKSSSNIIETKKTENHSKSEDVFNLYDENETES
ncbi:uncharacterized protein LOC113386117 [Ctenocephalides felis]|uniref:uncharacterized protein LOC113386117 n=1 Tax=Ctenocephalides felis TaxID=7515 RepID=UPI000E6E2C4E|nr:uncharacterized protein LOC113386117 [Ctenocephalides felis]